VEGADGDGVHSVDGAADGAARPAAAAVRRLQRHHRPVRCLGQAACVWKEEGGSGTLKKRTGRPSEGDPDKHQPRHAASGQCRGTPPPPPPGFPIVARGQSPRQSRAQPTFSLTLRQLGLPADFWVTCRGQPGLHRSRMSSLALFIHLVGFAPAGTHQVGTSGQPIAWSAASCHQEPCTMHAASFRLSVLLLQLSSMQHRDAVSWFAVPSCACFGLCLTDCNHLSYASCPKCS